MQLQNISPRIATFLQMRWKWKDVRSKVENRTLSDFQYHSLQQQQKFSFPQKFYQQFYYSKW